jgi:hypothetical protein
LVSSSEVLFSATASWLETINPYDCANVLLKKTKGQAARNKIKTRLYFVAVIRCILNKFKKEF